MTGFIVAKLLVTLLALLFCAIPNEASWLWAACCCILCFSFARHIPSQNRFALLMIIPLIITIAGLQLISARFSGAVNIQFIFVTGFKIACTGCIVISARYFIGREALKLFAHRAPFMQGLFFLVFSRTIYIFMRLNKMIAFQLQSRLDLQTSEKYYIPKYYATAMIFNQFYCLHRYHSGILSRSIGTIPEVEIFPEQSNKAQSTIFATIIIVAVYIIAHS